MSQLRTFSRSTAISCLFHAISIGMVYCIPLSLIDRFTTSGQRQVIAIEMTLAPPSLSAVASPMSLATVQAPVTLEPATLIEPRQASTSPINRHPRRDTSFPLQPAESTLPRPTPWQLTKRQDVPSKLPQVAEQEIARPRRTPSVSMTPLATVPPLETLAGLTETQVEFLSNPPPKYPAAAVAGEIEGRVMLKLTIDRHGKVSRVEVLQSSGSDLLDDAARTAVMAWSGTPATRGGHPIESEEILPIRFRL